MAMMIVYEMFEFAFFLSTFRCLSPLERVKDASEKTNEMNLLGFMSNVFYRQCYEKLSFNMVTKLYYYYY